MYVVRFPLPDGVLTGTRVQNSSLFVSTIEPTTVIKQWASSGDQSRFTSSDGCAEVGRATSTSAAFIQKLRCFCEDTGMLLLPGWCTFTRGTACSCPVSQHLDEYMHYWCCTWDQKHTKERFK